MSKERKGSDEADFLDQLRTLSISAAYELVSGFDRLKQLHEESIAGDAVEGDVRKRRAALGDLAFRLAKTELEHAEALLNLSHSHAELLFDHARSLVRRARSGGPPPAVTELVPVDGHWVARFPVRNPFDVEAHPRFELAGFADDSGRQLESLKTPFVASEPGLVPARGQAEIVVRLPAAVVTALEAGTYFADFVVHLSADVELRVAHRLLRLRAGTAGTSRPTA